MFVSLLLVLIAQVCDFCASNNSPGLLPIQNSGISAGWNHTFPILTLGWHVLTFFKMFSLYSAWWFIQVKMKVIDICMKCGSRHLIPSVFKFNRYPTIFYILRKFFLWTFFFKFFWSLKVFFEVFNLYESFIEVFIYVVKLRKIE